MPRTRRLLLLGSTGNVGAHVVQALVEKASQGASLEMVVGTRSPPDSSPSGVLEYVRCDMSTPASLKATITTAKCHRMFVCLPQTFGPRQMVEVSKVVVDAAVEAGVELLVRVGALGQQHQGALGEAHEMCEQYCREKSLLVTSIRPTSFHTNFEKFDVESIKNEDCFRSPLGPTARVNWVHCGDIGRVAAEVMLQDQVLEVVEVTGPPQSNLSTGEMVALLSQELGKTVRYEQVNPPGLKEYCQLWAFLKRGGFDCSSGGKTVKRLTGREATDFREVVRQLRQKGRL